MLDFHDDFVLGTEQTLSPVLVELPVQIVYEGNSLAGEAAEQLALVLPLPVTVLAVEALGAAVA